MAVKQLAYEQEARKALWNGVEKLASAVKSTLGPRGRNAVLDKSWGGPTVTKDGVTVAEEVELVDKYENMGAQLVKEAASKTSEVAGDGTTTATVLAEAIFQAGLKNIAAGADAFALNRGIERAVRVIIDRLRDMSRPVKVSKRDDIINVARISANNDEPVGKLLADCFEKVGKDGVITVEDGKTSETLIEVVEGMQFDRGFLSPHFVTDQESMEAVLDRAYLLFQGNLRGRGICELVQSLRDLGAPGEVALHGRYLLGHAFSADLLVDLLLVLGYDYAAIEKCKELARMLFELPVDLVQMHRQIFH